MITFEKAKQIAAQILNDTGHEITEAYLKLTANAVIFAAQGHEFEEAMRLAHEKNMKELDEFEACLATKRGKAEFLVALNA